MNTFYYIGLDIHKRTIAYCIKAMDGRLIGQGKIEADRKSLERMGTRIAGSLDWGDGGDNFHRLGLRFSQAVCR